VLHRGRELLVRQRTMLVNGLRAHMAEFGIIVPQGIQRLPELVALLEDEKTGIPQIARLQDDGSAPRPRECPMPGLASAPATRGDQRQPPRPPRPPSRARSCNRAVSCWPPLHAGRPVYRMHTIAIACESSAAIAPARMHAMLRDGAAAGPHRSYRRQSI